MNKNEHIERHLDLCRRVYLRMLAEGGWPWSDDPESSKSEDMVESESNPKNL